ncbi:SDR family NAD(P)-dependent oxidoreductase, partial [Francisella tularensis subsp. holarctica]|uniref:SDR family NAD(P)-dependent oxidoreductase n=1 Tax=Francisella tularensis TaxID=263 RepID=UPI002381C73B
MKSGVDETVKKLGRIDTVVYNAGMQLISPIVDFSISAWKLLFDIHMTCILVVSQAALSHMIELKTGCRIIVV